MNLRPISSKTLTEEVVKRLQDAIADRQLSPGEKLPGEPKLAQQLGVSRNTLREAINILISKEVLYRNRGIGTFVSESLPVNLGASLERLISTTEVIKQGGYVPGTTNFDIRTIAAEPDIAHVLRINEGDTIVQFARTRTADGVPVIRSHEHIPLALIEEHLPYLRTVKSLENWSIYGFFKEVGLELSYVVSKVRAIKTDQRLARQLGCASAHRCCASSRRITAWTTRSRCCTVSTITMTS